MGFVGHTVSVTRTQLYCDRAKAGVDNMCPGDDSSRGHLRPDDTWPCLEASGTVTIKGCCDKVHKLGGLRNRNLMSYGSGG